jgi:uncharacterized SAM-binding protein YcdF (DUF218 family)
VDVSRALRWVGALGLLVFAGTAFTPAADRVSRLMSVSGRLERAPAIVVLGGGGVRSDGSLNDTSLRRTWRGIDLYHQRLAPLLVLLGTAAGDRPAEGEVRSRVARACGVPADAILTETHARTTREEAVNVRALLEPRGIRRVLLVADVEGMGRAKGAFERVGFEVVPAPSADVTEMDAVPESRIELLRRVLMELWARVYYRLAGYL